MSFLLEWLHWTLSDIACWLVGHKRGLRYCLRCGNRLRK